MSTREPILHAVPIGDLRPTQMTVGFREVEAKRREWRRKHGEHAREFLGRHMIPVLKGPKDRLYVIDHHHLARALHEEGVADVLVNTVSDLSALGKDAFWVVCEHRGWVHPYDADGVRHPCGALPKRIADLKDDPYRSLAGELRRAGGFAKDVTPFAEFLWADFLRRRIPRKQATGAFEAALQTALELARSGDAGYLPGWSGPVEG